MPPKPSFNVSALGKAPVKTQMKFSNRNLTEMDREDDAKGFKNVIRRGSMFGENTLGHKVLKHIVEEGFEKPSKYTE